MQSDDWHITKHWQTYTECLCSVLVYTMYK